MACEICGTAGYSGVTHVVKVEWWQGRGRAALSALSPRSLNFPPSASFCHRFAGVDVINIPHNDPGNIQEKYKRFTMILSAPTSFGSSAQMTKWQSQQQESVSSLRAAQERVRVTSSPWSTSTHKSMLPILSLS